MEPSQIQEFYKNSKVFVTGGTGFLGKILIEKLLRDTEVATIYVLVREKKGKDVRSRIAELFDDEVFFRLKPEMANIKSRIKPVSGDISLSNLGMSETDTQILASNVDIVFHIAATLKFTEHIKDAVSINVGATKEVLKLARKMKHLKAYVHVSTAFSNCNRRVIKEQIYEHPYETSDLEDELKQMDKDEAEKNTNRILGDWPNTYTFTKALAENEIKKQGHGLPVGIFRPSIVISTYKEPLPGWVDNTNGATGAAMGALTGMVRVLHVGRTKVSDMVPVDTCVAGLIATAWDAGDRFKERLKSTRNENSHSIPVYNFVSSNENPLTWGQFSFMTVENCQKYPHSKAIWTPQITIVNSIIQKWIYGILFHFIPALLLDFVCFITRKKARLLRSYIKIYKFFGVVDFFAVKEWQFSNDNVTHVWKRMNQFDRDLFPMNMEQVLWFVMFDSYIKGIRKYLLKEDNETINVAIKRNKRFQIAEKILKIVLLLLMSYLIWLFVTYTYMYVGCFRI